MIDAVATAREIEGRCREAGNPERAVGERAYLKGDLEHYGAGVPEIRRIVRHFAAAHRDLTHDELAALIDELWARPVHELRSHTSAQQSARRFLTPPRPGNDETCDKYFM